MIGGLIKGLQGLGKVKNPYYVRIDAISGLSGESAGLSGVYGSPTWFTYTDKDTGQQKFLVAYAVRNQKGKTAMTETENVYTGDKAQVKKNADDWINNFKANIAPYKDADLYWWDNQMDIQNLMARKGSKNIVLQKIADPNVTGQNLLPAYAGKEGAVLRGKTSGATYLIENGKRRQIMSVDAFTQRGLSWDKVVDTDDSIILQIPAGDPLVYQKTYAETVVETDTAAKAAADASAATAETSLTTDYSVATEKYQPGPLDQFNLLDWKVKLGLVAGIIGGIGAAVYLGGKKRR